MDFNPLALLAVAYQQILVSGQWPRWSSLLPAALLAAALCLLAYRLYRKHAGEMVDEL
jgi:lipopolysaccharide transport system permease protein